MGTRQRNAGDVTRKRRRQVLYIIRKLRFQSNIRQQLPDLYRPVTRAPHDLISKIPSSQLHGIQLKHTQCACTTDRHFIYMCIYIYKYYVFRLGQVQFVRPRAFIVDVIGTVRIRKNKPNHVRGTCVGGKNNIPFHYNIETTQITRRFTSVKFKKLKQIDRTTLSRVTRNGLNV